MNKKDVGRAVALRCESAILGHPPLSEAVSRLILMSSLPPELFLPPHFNLSAAQATAMRAAFLQKLYGNGKGKACLGGER